MTIRNLDRVFRPRSVALIGASERPGSVGRAVFANLLEGGFRGPVFPVNPRHRTLLGRDTYPDVASLPETPELAVICTPPAAVPGIIAALGSRGSAGAVVITGGLTDLRDANGRTLELAALDAARPHLVRIIGPNCIGMLVPGLGLNASFAAGGALPGHVAFVSQSGGLGTAVIDWARSRGIGFSHFVSLGNGADVDFGDMLDYLANDPGTRAILLYVEALREARKFISAARAAARNKPVIVAKSGRAPDGARAAASHTGALAGEDIVYDAVIRRAGMLRVHTIDELFAAVETLARAIPLRGHRLAIVTNGGGPGVMATDALVLGGGTLATLADATVRELDGVLPRAWSRGNPVDIIGDAPPGRYASALALLLADPGVDAVLVLHSPSAIAPSREIAQSVIETARQACAGSDGKRVLTSWLGGDAVTSSRRAFGEAGLPTYDTPEDAVRAFAELVEYGRNQRLLMEVAPASRQVRNAEAIEGARSIIAHALAAGRELLDPWESAQVLGAYGIPVVETRRAPDIDGAVQAAESLGYPVALKIVSPEATHKSDVGGVALDVGSEAELRSRAGAMVSRLGSLRPGARATGFVVQRMARSPGAIELIAGVATDPVFGAVILFGHGGTAAEVIGDRAVALPPLNEILARDLIGRTRVARLLAGYRGGPPVDIDAVAGVLVALAELVADLDAVSELDINPLLASAKGVLALDARVRVLAAEGRVTARGVSRLAIRPYPRELEEWTTVGGRRVLLRPIRPEDEGQHQAFFERLSPADIRFRFFGAIRELPHSQMARFTQIDYDREMAMIATATDAAGSPETLGVVRMIADPNNETAEFAIVVRSDVQGRGLGRALLEKAIRYARGRGTRTLVGQVLADNAPMLSLARDLGFSHRALADAAIVETRLKLNE